MDTKEHQEIVAKFRKSEEATQVRPEPATPEVKESKKAKKDEKVESKPE